MAKDESMDELLKMKLAAEKQLEEVTSFWPTITSLSGAVQNLAQPNNFRERFRQRLRG